MAVGVRAMKPLFWFAVTRKLLELVWTATGLLSAPLGDGLVALVALVACGGVLFPAITALIIGYAIIIILFTTIPPPFFDVLPFLSRADRSSALYNA